jgi:hypothetical protein
MRATRALLRRRGHRLRTRAERLTPLQHTTSQDNRPEMGQKLADQATRDGVAERCSAPAVPKRLDVDLALSGHSDARLRDVERSILKAAKLHHANTLDLRRTVPGIGEILSLGLRYEMHDIQRFPRVQDCVSDCRLVKGAKASAGKRDGRRPLVQRLPAARRRLPRAPPRMRAASQVPSTGLERRWARPAEDLAAALRSSPLGRATDAIVPRRPGVGPVLSRPLVAEGPAWGLLHRQAIAALSGVAPVTGDRLTARRRKLLTIVNAMVNHRTCGQANTA